VRSRDVCDSAKICSAEKFGTLLMGENFPKSRLTSVGFKNNNFIKAEMKIRDEFHVKRVKIR